MCVCMWEVGVGRWEVGGGRWEVGRWGGGRGEVGRWGSGRGEKKVIQNGGTRVHKNGQLE